MSARFLRSHFAARLLGCLLLLCAGLGLSPAQAHEMTIAELTVRATSIKKKVTLRGIVMDKKEKDYVGGKAEEIAGYGNVDNRLTIL